MRNGTSFDTDLRVGDKIILNNESRFVNSITEFNTVDRKIQILQTTVLLKEWVFTESSIGGTNYKPNVFQHLVFIVT